MSLTQSDALRIIADTSRGDERAKLLEDDAFRRLVLNSGANVTIFDGKPKEGNTFKERFEDIYVGLIQRKNKHGKLDGLGALGGMAERTSMAQFLGLSEKEREMLLGQKDDVIMADGKVILTDDMDIIRKNNVLREMREELEDLGIKGITLNPDKLQLVPMPCVKDDNYMINIWDGKGDCFAVTPYCHLYKDEENLLDTIAAMATERAGGEAVTYKKVPLFEALSAFGNIADKESALEDGRSAVKDYRYPHEHLAVWFLASKFLEHDAEKFIALAQEVQKSCRHQVSFAKLAEATGQGVSDLADVLKVPTETLQQADKKCARNLCFGVMCGNTINRR